MRNAVMAVLEGDATLMATLTGGLYSGTEISRQNTPDAFDAYQEIEPCGLLNFESQAPSGPHTHSSRLFLRVHLYERAGYTSIEAARARIYALLHDQVIAPAAGDAESGAWLVVHVGDVLDTEDPVLKASMCVTRFQATVARQ